MGCLPSAAAELRCSGRLIGSARPAPPAGEAWAADAPATRPQQAATLLAGGRRAADAPARVGSGRWQRGRPCRRAGRAHARWVAAVRQAAPRSADRSAQRLQPRRRWAAPALRWAAWAFGWGEWGPCPQTPGAGGPSRAGGHGSPGVGHRLRSKVGARFAPASRSAAAMVHDGALSWPHVIARQNRSLGGATRRRWRSRWSRRGFLPAR